MTYMHPFPPDGQDDTASCDRADHGWIVSHLISLIEYCESQGLTAAELALTEATERLAPILNGHRLQRLRAEQAQVLHHPAPQVSAATLRLSPVSGTEPHNVPA